MALFVMATTSHQILQCWGLIGTLHIEKLSLQKTASLLSQNEWLGFIG